ncbi:ABC transporter permease [Rothia aerolata]|uniref:Transport permease protein n=1 Tax=Rothia aerolata TaxID=1812262 RepID=A0A917IVE0_9MICC|nr:ABC transporter permease [Rothia aerolata]GGH65064.1 transport permease protein [Rothia aerolata]
MPEEEGVTESQGRPWSGNTPAVAEGAVVRYKPVRPLDTHLLGYSSHIESGRLYPVGVRTSLRKYLADTWERRWYIWKESRAKVETQNSAHRLGMWWMVIKPLADVIFYWVLFAVVLKASRGLPNYTAFIVIGVLMFRYFSQALNQGASSLTQGKAMMRAFAFPRIAIPIATLVRQTMNIVPVLMVMLLGIIFLPPHAWPHLNWLLFIPAFALAIIFNLGVILVVSRATFKLPDVQPALGVINRVLMYSSGVMFPIDRFLNHPVVLHSIQANPYYIFLDLFREILIYGHTGTFYHWGSLMVWSVGLLLVGFIYFYRGEEEYGRERN